MKKIIFSLVVIVFMSCSKDEKVGSEGSEDTKEDKIADKVLSGIIANDEFVAKGGSASIEKILDKTVLSVHFTASSEDNCDSDIYGFEYEVSVDVPLKEGKSDFNNANVVLSKDGVTPKNIFQSSIVVKKLTDSHVTIAIKAGDPSKEAFMGYKNYVEGVFTVPRCD